MKKTFSISEAISFGWNTFKSNWKFWIISFFIFTVASGSAGLFNFGNISDSIPSSKERHYLENSNEEDIEFDDIVDYQSETIDRFIEGRSEKVLGTSVDINSTSGDKIMRSKDSLGLAKILWLLVPFGIISFAGFLVIGIISFLITLVFRMGYVNLTLDAARGKDTYYKTLLNQVSMRKAWRLLNVQFFVAFLVFFGFLLFIIPGIILALKYSLASFVLVDLDKTPSEAMKISGKLTKNVRFKILWFGLACGLVMIIGLLAFGFGVVPASIVVSLAHAYVYNKLFEQSEFASASNGSVIPNVPAIETSLPSSNDASSVKSGNLLAEN